MPTLDNPGFYERAKFTAAGRADDFLKSLTPDDAIDDCGSVGCPIGFVMLVEIDRDLIREYVSREGDPWLSMSSNFEPGWYIVKTDDNGLVWGIGYGPLDSTFNEEAARADFEEACNAYSEWMLPDRDF